MTLQECLRTLHRSAPGLNYRVCAADRIDRLEVALTGAVDDLQRLLRARGATQVEIETNPKFASYCAVLAKAGGG